MSVYDEVIEINKNIDHIEEIEKFNPFHDSKGKFSSSNGMASYSANPKTKAGAMAINRSTAAGYGAVMNVHRESKGENIRQNDNWIKNGQKPTPRQLAIARSNAPKTLSQAQQNAHTNRVKGTMGATETATARHPAPKKQPQQQAQQQQNQQQTTATQAKQQQAQPAAKQTLAAQTANVTVSSSQSLAIQPRNASGTTNVTTKKIAKDHDQEYVAGKDISKKFDASAINGNARAIDKVAHANNWDKEPTVTNDLNLFQKAAVASGQIFIRTVHPEGRMSSEDICKETMTNGKASLGGNGGKVYGGGMYTVGAKVNDKTGRALGQQIARSQRHSFAYGDTQMMATVHPKAKIATPTQAKKMRNEFFNLSFTERTNRFGDDVGAYIASKGYDGTQWHNRSDPYITMYNKSAMIFYSGVAK